MARATEINPTSSLQESVAALSEAARQLGAVANRLADAAVATQRVGPAAAETSSPGAGIVGLTPGQKRIMERVLNVYETGSIRGDYANISIFHDGPHHIRQITYGRSQTTEYGHLGELVKMYVDAGGQFSEDLRPFVPLIGNTSLVDNDNFKNLLRRAGSDPVMQQTQDVFFDKVYFQPAIDWANRNGFTLALSALVIYDSFIHSGGILSFLRSRFAERPPAAGGREQVWIHDYVRVRHEWLATNESADLRATIYRTRDLMREIDRGNWDLAMLPIMANGTPVDDRDTGSGMVATMGVDVVPFLGDPVQGSLDYETVWCELEPPVGAAFAAAAAPSTAALAQSLLANSRVTLATSHSSGVQDEATAKQNMQDTANGLPARRSSYGNAPGGTVALNARMLSGLVTLAGEFSFSVAELCGGSHSPNSRHYAGVTADVNVINGIHVGASHPNLAAFMQRCRDLGVTELLGPGDPGHSTHVHAGWPRPA
jgi:chitosanase